MELKPRQKEVRKRSTKLNKQEEKQNRPKTLKKTSIKKKEIESLSLSHSLSLLPPPLNPHLLTHLAPTILKSINRERKIFYPPPHSPFFLTSAAKETP